MAQREINAKAITWTNSGSHASEIASLRTNIQAGNIINAFDLNRIGTLINQMNGHYHTYDDAWQLPTYGNNGDRTPYIEDKNTSTPDAVTSAPVDHNVGASITATKHNGLATALNQLRSHYHEIDDRTG